MAKLKVEATTWANGKQLKPHYRLGDSEATAVLTSSRTLVKVHLFADGSGLVILTRGAERQAFELNAEDKHLALVRLFRGHHAETEIKG